VNVIVLNLQSDCSNLGGFSRVFLSEILGCAKNSILHKKMHC